MYDIIIQIMHDFQFISTDVNKKITFSICLKASNRKGKFATGLIGL